MNTENVFHAGEREVQERASEEAQAVRNAAVIADSIMGAALPFVAAQPMVVVGSVDAIGDVWASMVMGEPGFMTASDPHTIDFDLTRVFRDPHDPLWENLKQDRRAGLLMIELTTRRRLRVNGSMEMVTPERLQLRVDESYPNCPKYIQRRHLGRVTTHAERAPVAPRTGNALDASTKALIETGDTMFVASVAPGGGVDASHRGGPPGFVRILDERTLRVPDYVGNSMFNTLGNFAAYPRAGLLFPDFERSRVLQLVGRPEIRWDLGDSREETGGTRRYWDFIIDRWVDTTLPFETEWEFLDSSPFNPEPLTTPPSTQGAQP